MNEVNLFKAARLLQKMQDSPEAYADFLAEKGNWPEGVKNLLIISAYVGMNLDNMDALSEADKKVLIEKLDWLNTGIEQITENKVKPMTALSLSQPRKIVRKSPRHKAQREEDDRAFYLEVKSLRSLGLSLSDAFEKIASERSSRFTTADSARGRYDQIRQRMELEDRELLQSREPYLRIAEAFSNIFSKVRGRTDE